MAILRDLTSGAIVPLPSRVVVGRAPTAGLRLADARVSGEHATIVWTGKRWELRDLGSRNGTFVKGKRLDPGVPYPIAARALLSFGDPRPACELVEDSPPGPLARDLRSGQWVAGHDGILVLPDALNPEVSVFVDPTGAWCMEAGDERRPVADGEVVDARGERFALALPASFEGTDIVGARCSIQTVGLSFLVSSDEEHVQLSLVQGDEEIPLGGSEHWYVLLTLARKRIEDAKLPPAQQGWMDRDWLSRSLQLDQNALNVSIFRMRGRLAAAGLLEPVGIIEVRRAQRRIGIPPERLRIVRVSSDLF